MEEHGSVNEVARERKLMQAEQNAPMVNEEQDLAGVVVENLDGRVRKIQYAGKDCLNQRGIRRSRWGLAGGRMKHFL